MNNFIKIQFIRIIDFWVGIPLCFLLSVFEFFHRLIPKRTGGTHPSPKKILIIKLSELGAIILSYPLQKQLREQYPGAELYFLTFERNKQIFHVLQKGIPEQNVLTVRDKIFLKGIGDLLRVMRSIRREQFDVVLDLEFFSRFSAAISYLSGSKKRVGFDRYSFEGLYRGDLFTHKIQFNPLSHVSKTFFSFSQVIDYPQKKSPEMQTGIYEEDIVLPKLKRNHSVEKKMLSVLTDKGIDFSGSPKLFLINPGEGMVPLREWPLDNFIQLGRFILNTPNTYLILVGEKNNEKKDIVFEKKLNTPRCINLTAQTNLTELLELFYIAQAMIINDCGLAHLASLTTLKNYVIFGPESPQVFSPLGENHNILYSEFPCSPCLSALNHRKSYCRDNGCLKVIAPEDLYKLIDEDFLLNTR